jgi:hypothetical protein
MPGDHGRVYLGQAPKPVRSAPHCFAPWGPWVRGDSNAAGRACGGEDITVRRMSVTV